MNNKSAWIINCILWITWSLCFVSLGTQHVSWRDEYQSWLVSTRTETLPEFFEAVRYERHPPLQYILQRSLYTVLPETYASEAGMRSVAYLFSILTVGLILFFFPLSLGFRILLILGIPFVLEYGLIARTYALGSFFLLGAGLLERRQHRRWTGVFYVLASMTHLYFTLFVGAITIFRVLPLKSFNELKVKLRKDFLVIALLTATFLSIVLQRPPLDSAFGGAPNPLHFNIGKLLMHLGWGLTGFDHFWGPFEWNATPQLIGIFGLVFLGLLWKLRKTSAFSGKEFLFVIAVPLLLMNLSYAPATRHVLLIWIALLYFVIRDQVRPPLFRLMIFCMVFATFRYISEWQPWNSAPAFDFSGQRELQLKMGPTLQSPDSILVVENEDIFFPVMGRLGINVYSAKRDRLFKYTFFRRTEWKYKLEDWCHAGGIEKLKTSYKSVFLGLPLHQAMPESCGHGTLVFESARKIVFDEKYSVYEVQ